MTNTESAERTVTWLRWEADNWDDHGASNTADEYRERAEGIGFLISKVKGLSDDLSDAQVNAALNAHRLSDLLNSGYGPEKFNEAPDLSYWHPDNVSNMRAAVRAAFKAGEI